MNNRTNESLLAIVAKTINSHDEVSVKLHADRIIALYTCLKLDFLFDNEYMIVSLDLDNHILTLKKGLLGLHSRPEGYFTTTDEWWWYRDRVCNAAISVRTGEILYDDDIDVDRW